MEGAIKLPEADDIVNIGCARCAWDELPCESKSKETVEAFPVGLSSEMRGSEHSPAIRDCAHLFSRLSDDRVERRVFAQGTKKWSYAAGPVSGSRCICSREPMSSHVVKQADP